MNKLPYIDRKSYKNIYRLRYCVICGKQAVKGKCCQSCSDFISKMQKRDQARG